MMGRPLTAKSGFISLLDLKDADNDGFEEEDVDDADDGLSIEKELYLLRQGGPALVREYTLAAKVGANRAMRQEVTQVTTRLKRFATNVHSEHSGGASGQALLSEVTSFLNDSMDETALRAAAGKSLASACALEVKDREIAKLQAELTAAKSSVDNCRTTQAELEDQVRTLQAALAAKPRKGETHSESVPDHSHAAPESFVSHEREQPQKERTSRDAAITEGRELIEQITAKRLPREGSDELRATLGRALVKLSGDIYDSSNHFFHEIVQNCDDCKYSADVVPTMRIVIRPRSVSMMWNEKGFTQRDVRALCDLGCSTKGEGAIGRKGVGFKSVFMISDAPQIISNEFSFGFDLVKYGQVGSLLPIWQDRDGILSQLPAEWAEQISCGLQCTALHLPLKEASTAPQIVLEPATLLFLRKLRHIEITDLTDASQTRRRALSIDTCSELIHTLPDVGHNPRDQAPTAMTVREASNTSTQDSVFWVYRYPIRSPQEEEEIRDSVTLAFPFAPNKDAGVHKGQRRALPSQPLFCFLPICHVGLPFLLHADGFELTTSRQSIRSDSSRNSAILAAIPDAFKAAVVASPALHDDWIQYVPDESTLSAEVWRKVCCGIRARMAIGTFFRGESGKLRRAAELVLRPTWYLPVSNEQLQEALGLEFAADKAAPEELASYGVQNFSAESLLDVIDTHALDSILQRRPSQVYAAFQRLGGYDGPDGEKTLSRLWRAAIFPVFPTTKQGRTSSSKQASNYSKAQQPCELISLGDSPLFRNIPPHLDMLAHAAFRVLAETSSVDEEDREFVSFADQFLDLLEVKTATLETIVSCIVDHHRAGATTSSISDIFSELQFVRTFQDRLSAEQRRELNSSILVPTREGSLVLAKEMYVSTFLGLPCNHCEASRNYPEKADTAEHERSTMLSFGKSQEQANDDSLVIQSRVVRSGTESSVHFVLTKLPSERPSGSVASFAPRRGKIRMDYGIGVEYQDSSQKHTAVGVSNVALGYGIDSTSCDTFGHDLYSFCVSDNGFLYNGDVECLYEDVEHSVMLRMSPGSVISTCLDLESLTVAFCKNGEPLFFKSGETSTSIPMQIFADAALFPYVKIVSGTLTGCFTNLVKSSWMDAQVYKDLAYWNKTSNLLSTCKPANFPQVPPHIATNNAASADWEFFLLGLGCQPHHRACRRRSFWASLLEGGELGDCAICMSPLLGLKKAVCVPACRHVFHPQCIRRWLQNSTTCPVCRGTAFSHQLETPEPDSISHVFSEMLVSVVKVLVSGGQEPQKHVRVATQRALGLYLQDSFSKELLRNLPVSTTRGPRRLRHTFFRTAYYRLGGSALPYVLDASECDVQSCHAELDGLGIAHELSVSGILACLRELKAALSPKRQSVAFNSDDSAVSDDMDVMSQCYGQLWAKLMTSSSYERMIAEKQFERYNLIMLRDYQFVGPSKTMWECPEAIDGVAERQSLRPMYGSLKGLFVTGLEIPRTLSFSDSFQTLLTVHLRVYHDGKLDSRPIPGGKYTKFDTVMELFGIMDRIVAGADGAAAAAEKFLAHRKLMALEVPLLAAARSGRDDILQDATKIRFLERGEASSTYTAHFLQAFAEPSDLFKQSVPNLYGVLKRLGFIGSFANSVVDGPIQITGPVISLSWWTAAVAEFVAQNVPTFRAMCGLPPLRDEVAGSVDSISRAASKICVFAVKRITNPLTLNVSGFPGVDAVEDRYYHSTETGFVYCLESTVDEEDRAGAVAAGVVQSLRLAGVLPNETDRSQLDTALREFLFDLTRAEAAPTTSESDERHTRNAPPPHATVDTTELDTPWDQFLDRRHSVERHLPSTPLVPPVHLPHTSTNVQCPHCGLEIEGPDTSWEAPRLRMLPGNNDAV